MRTLTFEQLRINLTLTFDKLDEPIQIIKRGKVQGYIIKELPEKAEGKDMPDAKIKAVKMPGEAVKQPETIKQAIVG